MRHTWFRSALAIVVFSAALQSLAHGAGKDTLIEAVNSVHGWKAAGKPVTFDESTIGKFSPQLASSLRTYEIAGITEQAWHGPSGVVRATLFQFADASTAYGFFSIRRKADGIPASDFSIGAESFRSADSSYLWQSGYVVRLEGKPDATEALARILSEKILGRSQRPPLVSRLPSANLVSGSEEYFLDAADIRNLDEVVPSSLGFEVSAEAAGADYRVDGRTVHLLLVLYPTQQIAKKYADQINLTTPKHSAARKRIGPLLAIVSGTTEIAEIQTVMDQVHYQSKVNWTEPPAGLGLGPVIVTVFTFIAILLGACIVIGIGLGGVRIMSKNMYPNRGFNRPQDIEIIQLKLDQELTRKEISGQ